MKASKWDIRFLRLAKEVSSWSKDPSTQAGAVIVRPDKTVLSVGFNGFPKYMADLPQFYADRDEKYSRIVHAEMNALLHAYQAVEKCTLYTWPLPCCERCVVHMLQAGIQQFVSVFPSEEIRSRWGASLERSYRYIKECQAEQLTIARELVEVQ